MGKKKDQKSALGRSIIRSRFAKTKRNHNTFLHTTELPDGYDWGRLNLTSVTEQSNLADFLTTAEMAGTEFVAEKMNVMVIDPSVETGLPDAEVLRQREITQDKHREKLCIPRRPEWDENTSAEELAQRERDGFLEWRRDLALLQEENNLILTPYEKNLEFWRQLWRVIERRAGPAAIPVNSSWGTGLQLMRPSTVKCRSALIRLLDHGAGCSDLSWSMTHGAQAVIWVHQVDMIVQIVDARNPLLFYCEDLEKYVREVDPSKLCLVLVNKADFLTADQRQYWLDYFTSKKVKVVFWSALNEAARYNEKEKLDDDDENDETDDSSYDSHDESDDESSDVSDEQSSYNESDAKEDKIRVNLSGKQKSSAKNGDETTANNITPRGDNEQIDAMKDTHKNIAKNAVSEADVISEVTSLNNTGDAKNSDMKVEITESEPKIENTKSAAQNSDNNVQVTDSKVNKQNNVQVSISDVTNNSETSMNHEPLNETPNATCTPDNDAAISTSNNDTLTDYTPLPTNNGDIIADDTPKNDNDSLSDHIPVSIFADATSDGDLSCDIPCDLLTVDQLLDVFRRLCVIHRGPSDAVTTIGMVGYPNVGKSSTINTILHTKKVPVSATPGRTKHFQTLYVADDLMLCDCPGLVFPSFVSTKAELVVNGILPIDQMREHIPPVSLVCERIPRPILCRVYGIMLPAPADLEDPSRPPTAYELLASYALMRGYMTHKGLPDNPRASRHILKDYVNGKLVFAHPPPSVDTTTYQPTVSCCTHLKTRLAKKDDKAYVDKPVADIQGEVDQDFFNERVRKVHVRGGVVQPSFIRPSIASRLASSSVASSSTTSLASTNTNSDKPWRQKEKRTHKKREKLRRVYRHLDVHA